MYARKQPLPLCVYSVDRISLYVIFSRCVYLRNVNVKQTIFAIFVCICSILFGPVALSCRKIRLIEGNAKCRHLKQWTYKGTLRQVFVCPRPRTSYHPPSLHTVYVYIVNLFTQGRGRRVEPERRVEGQQFTKHGSKIPRDWKYLQSILYATGRFGCLPIPHSVNIFRWRHFAFVSL